MNIPKDIESINHIQQDLDTAINIFNYIQYKLIITVSDIDFIVRENPQHFEKYKMLMDEIDKLDKEIKDILKSIIKIKNNNLLK